MKELLLMLLLSAGLTAQAQQKSEPIQGFWVIENNTSSPKKQVVKFYDANQQLIYQENYSYKVLNCSRKRVRKMLDGALTTVLNNNTSGNAALANLIKPKP